MFSARQEALREGRGAQLTVGVGMVRWATRAHTVNHPLVMMPAELGLADDGSLIVRKADAAKAGLWLFPGVAAASTALGEMDKCAKDYRLTGTLTPPPPTDRDSWEPLLERAAHCLAPDGEYVAGPPPKANVRSVGGRGKGGKSGGKSGGGEGGSSGSSSSSGGSGGGAGSAPRIFNSFVLFTRDVEAAGEGTISKDAAALGKALRSMPAEELPAALGRLAGVYGLPPLPRSFTHSFLIDNPPFEC